MGIASIIVTPIVMRRPLARAARRALVPTGEEPANNPLHDRKEYPPGAHQEKQHDKPVSSEEKHAHPGRERSKQQCGNDGYEQPVHRRGLDMAASAASHTHEVLPLHQDTAASADYLWQRGIGMFDRGVVFDGTGLLETGAGSACHMDISYMKHIEIH